MTRRLLLLALALAALMPSVLAQDVATSEGGFQDRFEVNPAELSPTGRNPYFILEPGHTLRFEGMEDDEAVVLIITVLDDTELVGNVRTRVIEEQESAGGELAEVSRNFFAISTRTQDVFYFGEDVDIYKDGAVVGHEGSWRAGEKGNRFGLMMPGTPKIGMCYYQEIAPGIAMDRAEIVSLSEAFEAPIGVLDHLLKTEETSAVETGAKEYKYYAPGIGLVKDGTLLLVSQGQEDEEEED
jgi:hypothetical protein